MGRPAVCRARCATLQPQGRVRAARMPLLALLVLALLAPSAALAQVDGRIAYLSRQLERGKDPRVRAQSALVLGATEDPDALAPLCKALADPSELVRAAAARSLGT